MSAVYDQKKIDALASELMEPQQLAGGGAIRRAAEAVRQAADSELDMSTEARMQRAAEQGYTDRLTHSSSEVFAGSPQAEEAMEYGIPIQTEFKKTFGGTYFAPEGSLSEDIFSKGPFGGSAEYLLNKGNNFNANYRNMSEAQKKELTEIIGSVVDADDIDNAFDVFTDGDFYQTYGRKAQDDLMNAFFRRGYDSVTFPDNLAMGDLTQSTVIFEPSNIRSVNAAFDPAKRESSNILSGLGAAAIGAGALTSEDDPEGMSKGGLVDKLRSAASSVKEAGNVYKAAVGNMFSPFEPTEPQLGDPNDYEFPELRLRRPGIVNLALGMPNMPADMRYLYGAVKDAAIGDEVPDEEWRRFDMATEAQGRYEDDMDAFLRSYTGKSVDELSGPMSAVLGVSEALAQPGVIPAKLVAGLPRAARYLSNLAEFATPVTVASPGAMLTGAGFNAGLRVLPALTDGDDLEQMNARYSGRELSGEEQAELDNYLQELLGKNYEIAEPELLAGGGAIRKAAEAVDAANKSTSNRPVNEQLGIDRAKSFVEESGYRWNDVKQITTPEEYLQFQRRYGLASAVSERDDPTDVFHKGGAMFYDQETGAPVAYAPSGSQRKKAEGMADGGLVYDADAINALANELMEPVKLAEGGPPRSRIRKAAEAVQAIDSASTANIPARPVAQSAASPESFRLYHGTPHVFGPSQRVRNRVTGKDYVSDPKMVESVMAMMPDQYEIIGENPIGMFDINRIGSGEGAQAYGFGAYGTQLPDVGRGYRQGLLRRHNIPDIPTIAGKPIEDVYSQIERRAGRLPVEQARPEYDKLSIIEQMMIDGDILGILQGRDDFDPEAMKWFEQEIAPKYERPGALYEMQVNAPQRMFLDWDMPIVDQTPEVQASLRDAGIYDPDVERTIDLLLNEKQMISLDRDPVTNAMRDERKWHDISRQVDELRKRQPANMTGRQAYYLSAPDARSQAEASEALKRAGIPGIQYLDQGSRGDGEGTRNFVIFDPKMIEILEKYGVAGATTGAGAMAMSGEEEPQEFNGGGKIRRAAAAVREATTPPREVPDELSVSDEEMMRIARDLGVDFDETSVLTDMPMPSITQYTAADRAAAGRRAASLIRSQDQMKASEALGRLMEQGFRRTSTTQADRTRVGGGNIGGPSFPVLGMVDPEYAGRSWGVMNQGTASRLMNLSSPETAWTTMLGSSDQLKSNPIVFDKLRRAFLSSMRQGNLSPELESKINQNLRLTFGEDANIRDPNIWDEANTFAKRAALADLLMGQGIAPAKGGVALGGEKSGRGVIFKPSEILMAETERGLLHPEHGGNVPTFALGPRLFTIGETAEYRPDLHPGFPTLLEGRDLGYNVIPTPTEVYLPDWHRRYKSLFPERKPGYYELTSGLPSEGLPSQELTDEYIRHLIREGFAQGGLANYRDMIRSN